MENWYKITLYRLIEICKTTASKYTRSKVRKALPADYAYVIEELITEKAEVLDKEAYYDSIVNTIIEIGGAENFIIALAELIQRLVVDHLHILGDIYDRGPAPHFIMDRLMQYHSLDIQWGNHDVVWMGAAAGRKPALQLWSETVSVMEIWIFWRMDTASICCRWRPLSWKHIRMIRARFLP